MLKCPRNLYNFSESYYNGRNAVLILNSQKEQREISKGCPQDQLQDLASGTFRSILY
jgi:hypothetical protein